MKKKALCLAAFLLLSLGLVACEGEEGDVRAPANSVAAAAYIAN